MYDILVYLFENYQHPTAVPGHKALFRKLSAVGFENTDIQEALNWLSDVQKAVQSVSALGFTHTMPMRIFSEQESKRLNLECRSFLQFLESANVLDAASRELVIEAALSLKDVQFDVNKLKVVTLIALWLRDRMPNSLILDELLSDDSGTLH